MSTNSSLLFKHGLIKDSFERSAKLGISNQLSLNTVSIPLEEIENRRYQSDDLMFIAKSLKETLHLLEDISQLLIIDQDGYILLTMDNALGENSSLQISPGYCLTEAKVGCNGIGLTLIHQKTIRTVKKQNYIHDLRLYTVVGIPIIRDNQLLGCTGFITAREIPELKLRIIENALENAVTGALTLLQARNISDEIYLVNNFLNKDKKNTALLLTNKQHKIIKINKKAELILQQKEEELCDHSIKEFILDNSSKETLSSLPQRLKLVFQIATGKKEFHVTADPVSTPDQRCVGWLLSLSPLVLSTLTHSQQPNFTFDDIVGQNKSLLDAINLAKAISMSPSSVLIMGESGTGKELFAQSIHYASLQKDGPLVSINCAAIPHELIASELFGYVDGAFTGAKKGGTQGKFLAANNGTLFLDEIGDMPADLQATLLKVLQDRAVVPIGGDKAIPVNVRIISATNQDLETLVRENRFRLDLYYRLNVIPIRIPPLAKRLDDIPLLVQHFINKHSLILGKTIIGIDDAAIKYLQHYYWPGNVRELENVIEMAVNITQVEELTVNDLPAKILNNQSSTLLSIDEQVIIPLEEVLNEVEKRHIAQALDYFHGNISQCANSLKITRATLYRKIEKYNLLVNIEN